VSASTRPTLGGISSSPSSSSPPVGSGDGAGADGVVPSAFFPVRRSRRHHAKKGTLRVGSEDPSGARPASSFASSPSVSASTRPTLGGISSSPSSSSPPVGSGDGAGADGVVPSAFFPLRRNRRHHAKKGTLRVVSEDPSGARPDSQRGSPNMRFRRAMSSSEPKVMPSASSPCSLSPSPSATMSPTSVSASTRPSLSWISSSLSSSSPPVGSEDAKRKQSRSGPPSKPSSPKQRRSASADRPVSDASDSTTMLSCLAAAASSTARLSTDLMPSAVAASPTASCTSEAARAPAPSGTRWHATR